MSQAPTEIARPQMDGTLTAHGWETILLAEDDSSVRRLIVDVLSSCGYQVLEAPSGSAAVRLAESHAGAIHLLLTDVVMPGQGGFALAEQLARARPGLRILYMSGYPDVSDGLAPLPPGLPLLFKPFAPSVLAARVREALDRVPGVQAAQPSGT